MYVSLPLKTWKQQDIAKEEAVKASGVTGENLILKLRKSLYGLKQAPAVFHRGLMEHLEAQGFSRLQTDRCILTGKTPTGATLILVVWVDDVLIVGPAATQGQETPAHYVLEVLLKKYAKITWNEQCTAFVGMQLTTLSREGTS